MSTDTSVIEKNTVKTKKVIKDFKKWNVIFFNDDVTSVQFVILVLKEVFNYNDDDAVELTYKIHNEGKSVVGTYVHEIAEQKAADTQYLAYIHGYPLTVKIHPS